MDLMPRSLYRQLLLIVLFILTMTIIGYGWFTGKKQSEIYLSSMKLNAEVLARNLAISCAGYLIVSDYAGMELLLLQFGVLQDIRRIQVSDSEGNVLTDVVHQLGSPPSVSFGSPALDVPSLKQTFLQIENDQMIVYQPIIAGSLLGWIKVTYSVDMIFKMQGILWRNSLLAGILGIIASFILLLFVLRPPIHAIQRISDFARRLNEFKGMQIPVMRRSIEIEQLGESLNYASLELYSTERQLIEERERLAVTLVSIGDGVIVTNTEGRIVLINRVAEELTGWTSQEAEGKLLTEIFCIINEETREISENPVEKVLRDGKIVGLANHTALISRNGRERSIGDSGAPIKDKSGKIMGVALVFRDITEKNRMEAELLKTEKLESLGILAGGIAHDFNNILTIVLGNISVAKRLSNSEDEIYERLKIAENATLKARELTQQLLIFSKGGAPVMKRGSVGNLLRETASFTLRGSNVKCDVFIPDKLWQVEMDEGQMSQVIQNLIINAQQAMPEGGLITLWAENITIENDIPNLQRGNYVMIGVEDKGSGIPEKHLPLIFDPYFTTKEKGSGLGLTIAHSIIKKHGGNITVKSKIDAGTTFYVYIPASYNNNKEDVIIEKRIQEITSKGTGRILIMDDEEYIRELVTNTLTHCGYNVESASNGEEAIELYKKAKKSGHAFDAVILDITVPGGMGGKETIKKLMEIDPDVKAIVSSGYSNDAVMAEFWKHGFKGVVTKPYKVEELYEVLQGVITINDSLAKNKP